MEFDVQTPKYLLRKENIVRMILFTAVFALIFINTYQPFNSRQWLGEGKEMSDTKYFLLSSMLVIIGMAVVAISRVIMYKNYGKKKPGKAQRQLSIVMYVLWVALEVVAMSFTFVGIEKLFFADTRDIFELLKISLKNTAWVLLLPYAILWLYFSWDDKNERLKKVYEAGRTLINRGNLLPSMINFRDKNGEVKFSVKAQDLVYLQGADNYFRVNYLDGHKLAQATIRGSLSSVQEELKSYSIIRCHRSYLVSAQRIKLVEKKAEAFQIRLDIPQEVYLPVSKTYVDDVWQLFSNK
ncbi:MAG: DNA-binding protein [Bacteroidales bacterium]|nr:DNA-binding protein [Bacteroidales bacterium]